VESFTASMASLVTTILSVILWLWKTRFPGLSCGVFSSAVLSTLSQYHQKYEKKKENGKKGERDHAARKPQVTLTPVKLFGFIV